MKILFAFMRTSFVWLLFFLGVMIFEFIEGQSLSGMFYSLVTSFGFLLCRIAEALEKISSLSEINIIVKKEDE